MKHVKRGRLDLPVIPKTSVIESEVVDNVEDYVQRDRRAGCAEQAKKKTRLLWWPFCCL
jgi:hypothetical protein